MKPSKFDSDRPEKLEPLRVTTHARTSDIPQILQECDRQVGAGTRQGLEARLECTQPRVVYRRDAVVCVLFAHVIYRQMPRRRAHLFAAL